MELSIVMPCLNEAETLLVCIRQAQAFLEENAIVGEVIIADNGSTDGSQRIAAEAGARVVEIAERGYGAALIGGIAAAHGTYVAMGDADDSYDFGTLGRFIERLRNGDDLVMGNRFAGGVAPGAMPWLHKFVGNPVLSFIGRLFFKVPIRDFHCGLRAFRKDSIIALQLSTTGMEFASEMVVKASLADLKISEVPTTLKKDGRNRAPHLRSFRDGWRHLRFLLLYSPRWVFFYPGLIMFFVGAVTSARLSFSSVTLGSINFDIGTLIFAAAFTAVGFQSVMFSILSRIYSISAGLLPNDGKYSTITKYTRIETGFLLGVVFLIIGLGLSFSSIVYWRNNGYGELDPREIARIAVPGSIGIVMGFQSLFAGFFASLLKIDTPK